MKWSVLIALASQGAAAQTALDRADPRLIERTLPPASTLDPAAAAPPTRAPTTGVRQDAGVTGVVRAVIVEGRDRLAPALFAEPIAAAIGQELNRAGVAALAGAIAAVARRQGYPLATAQVPAQRLTNGILRVALDLGRIDAVRVIGARSAAADRLLARALIAGQPVRQRELERALLLVGDLPGVRVTGSRLVRQDGFGILLVTIESDRASAYVQLDNRGSTEIGPVRSTLLGSVRGIARDGDELAVIVAQTPLQPAEFGFARLRYGAPVGHGGAVLAASGSLSRTRPGGALEALDVRGRSADATVSLLYPFLRTRARSLWGTVELRALGTDQDLARRRLRRDRLATLSATIGGNAVVGGGVLRGELVATAGLPVAGTTRQGALLGSRRDGDARFVTGAYAVDWTIGSGKPFSMVFAAAGQLASRPLLAAAEIGLGGPAFGRGYDYAERTGDNGVMGSVEVRASTGAIPGSVVDRGQVYGFFDGGVVGNWRGGAGGGGLTSTGVGVRVGTGRLDWMAEVALPVGADRFDTGDRRPRVSLRVARAL